MVATIIPIDIEFDGTKEKANLAKHGISLGFAEILLSGPHLAVLDDRFAYGEERWQATGEIAGRLFVCVYTVHHDAYRIISLRKANWREVNAYRQSL